VRCVEPETIYYLQPSAVTTQARDPESGVAVNGKVFIDGREVGATNTPFVQSFWAPIGDGMANAPGLEDPSLPQGLRAPRLRSRLK
jgi:hypothetical protein